MRSIDPGHERTRRVVRRVGIALLILGGVLTLIGMASFFAAFGGMGPPRYFWCAFLGAPLGFAGLVLTMYGFLGAFARYSAGEVAPVGKDTFNYMAEGTQDGVRTMATAFGEGLGLREPTSGTAGSVACPKCSHANDVDAKFCDDCGSALPRSSVCASCRQQNDPDAKFCDNCGRPLIQ